MSTLTKRLALVRRLSGKHASIVDQAQRAILLKASELDLAGQGGGLVDLLMPKVNLDRRRLEKLARTYETRWVCGRQGGPRSLPVRRQAREEAMSDEIIAFLVVRFVNFVGDRDIPPAKILRGFVEWLQQELKKRGSVVYKYLSLNAPALLEAERSDKWWRERIRELRKKLG